MKKVLIIRFSALGDVAMTIPVTYSLARQHPDTEFVFLSKPALRKLFFNAPANFRFEAIEYKDKHKGFAGIVRLFLALRKEKFDCVADLHGVLRSYILTGLFRISGVRTATIDKQRRDKKELVKPDNKIKEELPSSFARYEAVFRQLKFRFKPVFDSIFEEKGDIDNIRELTGTKTGKWLGIAPFAKHKGKIYPIAKMEKVVELLSHSGETLFLFGGGKEEREILEQWQERYPNTISTVGKIDMEKELNLMSHLDGMITMDSGNMHLASLVGCPVVSVWGATHPCAGFYGWDQDRRNAVQIDLLCRPCSIFGDKPCYRKDYACLTLITPEMIVERAGKVFK